MENFLRKSPSFVAWAEKSKGKNDLLAMLDSIASLFRENDSLTRKQMCDELRKQGFDLSAALAGKYCLLFESAHAYLIDADENKREIFQKKFSNPDPNDYYRVVYQGVRCLIEDGIENFSQLGIAVDSENEEDDTGHISFPESQKEEGRVYKKSDDVKGLVLPDRCKEVDEADERLQDALSVIESLLEKRKNLCDQLQHENRSLRKDLEAETDSRIELEKNLDYAQKKILVLENETKDLAGINKGLKAKLEKANEQNQLVEINKKIELLLKQQRKPVPSPSKNKPEEKREEKTPQAKNDLLPKLYEPENTMVKYEEPFLKKLYWLSMKNAKLSRLITKMVKKICEHGIDNVSRIKTISNSSNHTPANSLQLRVKKYRMTFQRNGSQLVFYELFARKDTPFAVNRN